MGFKPTSLQDGLPTRFDLGRHNDIQTAVETKKDAFPNSWQQFHPAWRAVPLRLLWTTEHNKSFTVSIDHAGSAPPWPDRYIQDQQAFAFFVSGKTHSVRSIQLFVSLLVMFVMCFVCVALF